MPSLYSYLLAARRYHRRPEQMSRVRISHGDFMVEVLTSKRTQLKNDVIPQHVSTSPRYETNVQIFIIILGSAMRAKVHKNHVSHRIASHRIPKRAKSGKEKKKSWNAGSELAG